MSGSNLKTKTASGLFWGAMNNGLQQLVGAVVGLVLLSRLSPGDYGLTAMLAIFTAIAATLQEGGFKAALINRGEIRAEDHNAVFWLSTAVSCALYLVLFAFSGAIARFYNQPELVSVSRVLFLSFVFVSLSISSDALLLRKMMIRQRAAMDIAGAVASGAVAIVMAVRGCGYWALVAHSVVQSAVTSLLKLVFSPWKPSFKINLRPVWEMFPFGFKLVISSFVTQVHTNIFSVILGRAYSKAEVGFYSQGSKWANMGGQVFCGMLTSVAQPVLSSASGEPQRRTAILRKLTRFMAYVSCPAMMGLALVAPEFINLINPEFAPSVPILRIYCLYCLATLAHTMFNQTAMSYGRSDRYLLFTLCNASLQIATALATYRFGLIAMAAGLTAVNYIAVSIWFGLLHRVIGVGCAQLMSDILPFFLLSALCAAAAHFASLPVHGDLLRLLLQLSAAGGLYIALTSRTQTFRDVVTYIKKREL